MAAREVIERRRRELFLKRLCAPLVLALVFFPLVALYLSFFVIPPEYLILRRLCWVAAATAIYVVFMVSFRSFVKSLASLYSTSPDDETRRYGAHLILVLKTHSRRLFIATGVLLAIAWILLLVI